MLRLSLEYLWKSFNILQKNSSRIRTRIVRAVGLHDDHKTTATTKALVFENLAVQLAFVGYLNKT